MNVKELAVFLNVEKPTILYYLRIGKIPKTIKVKNSNNQMEFQWTKAQAEKVKIECGKDFGGRDKRTESGGDRFNKLNNCFIKQQKTR